MPRRPRVHMATAAAAAGTLLAGVLTAATAPAALAATHRDSIADTHPAWATGRGPGVTTGTVSARIYLAGRDTAGLTAYATAVSSPGSDLYRHYLSPAQVQARYGPTRSQVAAVESWARSAGLAVTGADGQVAGYVDVRGPVAAASRAFGVRFGRFKAPDGRYYRAPEQSATAPGPVAGDVLTISGLDTAPHLMKPQIPPPPYNYWVAHPCSRYYAQKVATHEPAAYGKHQPWTNCGYTPAQMRGAYGVAGVAHDRQGPDRGRGGRVRLADDPQGRGRVREGRGRPAVPGRPVQPAPDAAVRLQDRPGVRRRAGLVRRGVAGRGGRPRDGAVRRRAVHRCRELR